MLTGGPQSEDEPPSEDDPPSENGDHEVWYRGGLAFECTGCGDCCSGPSHGFVWVEDFEIEAIARHMGMDDLDQFERQFVRRVGARRSLVEYSDGDCIFLDPDTRRCSVYTARPKQCRTWPFWENNLESPQAWSRAARACPGCNQGRVYALQDIRHIMAEQSDVPPNAPGTVNKQ